MEHDETQGADGRLEPLVGLAHEQTALRYVRRHAAAYGAPAPTNEIAAELHMPMGRAVQLLDRMAAEGKLVSQPERYACGGWHEPRFNASVEPHPGRSE